MLIELSLIGTHYKRTLVLVEALSLDKSLFVNKISQVKRDDLKDVMLDTKGLGKRISSLDQKRLNEIFEIEQEKFFLRDSISFTKEIRKREVSQSKLRNIVLNKPYTKIFKMRFGLNPLVNTYESDWKWIIRESYSEVLEVKNILITKEEDHYFLFKRTGVYDKSLETNVLEYPLSEYSYFLLRLFESPITLMEATNRLLLELELESEREKKQIWNLTEFLIRELIFRMFIISI